MLAGGVLLILFYTLDKTDSRDRRFSEEDSDDPFIVAFSPELTGRSGHRVEEVERAGFSRGAVEAAPDSLPTITFTPARPRPRTATRPPFYRGNIEGGPARAPPTFQWYGGAAGRAEQPGGLRYYGAAAREYGRLAAPAGPTGQVGHPLRAAVEARPHLPNYRPVEVVRTAQLRSRAVKDMTHLRKLYLSEYGSNFSQSRPLGHSRKQLEGDEARISLPYWRIAYLLLSSLLILYFLRIFHDSF